MLAESATEWLISRGHKVERVLSDVEHSHEEGERPVGIPRSTLDEGELGAVDLAVSLGGDGTMLRTVAMTASQGIPVFGVNLGHLGYLTEVEPSGLESALERFVAGDYRIEERMTLEVSVERGELAAALERSLETDIVGNLEPHLVLNDAVVERTVPGHTIRVATQIAGRHFVTYAADGLVVATPTGSTAYNLSVRGPIVSPQIQAIILSPIAPHMLFDRPLVLAPEEWLRLELAPPRPALLVLDGQRVTVLGPGDSVVCRPGTNTARIVTFGLRDFHAILRTRFHLADR